MKSVEVLQGALLMARQGYYKPDTIAMYAAAAEATVEQAAAIRDEWRAFVQEHSSEGTDA